jgi:hypothetical protein
MKMICAVCCAAILGSGLVPQVVDAESPHDIGSRLELLADDALIEKLSGNAVQRLHQPVPHEVVLVTDKPWEGNTSAYYTIFQDGDLYRMYYRGSHFDEVKKAATHREVTCYAESRDGVDWKKPELGLFEFDGSRANNIVWDGIGTHCFTPFKDANPDCAPEARYKAVARGRPLGKKGLYIYRSPDAIHWTLMADEPAITTGAFDSQNLAFWDPERKLYVSYHRNFVNGVRAIMTCTSEDFVQWTEPVYLEYGDAPNQHLYTNAIMPYLRAPHIKIGFPTRYLPSEGSRVEPIFMISRDGLVFKRWNEALIPEDAPQDRNGNRSNYMARGLLQLPGSDRELSVYATEAYYTGPDSRIRRFSFRVDGFVSVHGETAGDTLLTRPLTFSGDQLVVNYQAAEKGSLRVEVQRGCDGKPIKGLSLADCLPLEGDEIEQSIRWRGGSLKGLSGKSVRLLFELRGADLYSLRFR